MGRKNDPCAKEEGRGGEGLAAATGDNMKEEERRKWRKSAI